MSTRKQGATTANKTKKQQKGAHPGIGAYVKGLLIDGKSTEEILLAIAKQFPEAQTTRSSVSWYRSKLRSLGKL